MKKILTLLTAVLIFNSFTMAQQNPSDTTMKTMELNEVVIKATRANVKLKDLPNKVEVVKAEPVFNGTASDVGQLLLQNTGIDVIQYPGKRSSVGMRGFSPTTENKYNVLLINGIPAGTQNISTIDLSNVEQVEVLKGPFSSLYGSNAMGGVINIVTPRTTGAIKGLANISYGSFKTSKVGLQIGGDIYKNWNFDLNAYVENQDENYKIGSKNMLSMDKTEKAILDESSFGATFPSSRYKQFGSNVRLGYTINDTWSIDINSGVYSAKNILMHGSYFGVYGDDKKDILRWNNSLSLEGKVNNHSISFHPYFHNDFNENYSDLTESSYITNNSRFKNYGFQLQDRITQEHFSIILGIDNNTQKFENKNWSDESTETAPYNPDNTISATGLLAQINTKLLDDQLRITAGGRFDIIRFSIKASELIGNDAAQENHSVFNPNVGVKYNFNELINAHGSFGTAFYNPPAFQKAGSYNGGYYSYVGNPDLKPESSNTADIGLGLYSKKAGVNLDLTYFRTRHKDMIETITIDPETNLRSYQNMDQAKMEGLEIMASYDFGALYDYKFSLKAYANFTVMLKSNIKIDSENDEEEMKYIRKVNGNFGLQFLYSKLSFKLNGRFIGHRIENNWYLYYPEVRPDLPTLAAESQPDYWEKDLLKHPQFLVFDANLYYDFSSSLTVGISAGNLFDENYTEKDGYNMPGRNFMGRCIVRF